MKLLLLVAILPYCYSNLCPKGEYWSTFSEICIKCTQCKSNQITIRTCQTYKNTLCSTSVKMFNNHKDNNKLQHHFEKEKLHYINNDYTDEIIDNILKYPSLNLENKHKKQNLKKQRVNDKFLKWDVDDDYDYDTKKSKKHLEHKTKHHDKSIDSSEEEYDDDDYNFDLKKSKKHLEHKTKHHDKSIDSSNEDDLNVNNLDAILNKNSKNIWNNKKWKDDLIDEHKIHKNNKKTARLAKLEDERKLEEWLIQSRKQFKDRKDTLLKTLREDRYENDKRIRLNYPLLNKNERYIDSAKFNGKITEKLPRKQHHIDSEVELFKELIKNEESQEMELATLMSNKKETYHYKTVTPVHRMFLGQASSKNLAENNIKNPDDVIKDEIGNNVIFEKSKFNILPIIKNVDEDIVPVDFTAAERLVWDWQAVAVVSAIVACFLFFLVIGIFLLFNAKQWKTTKYPFGPVHEELSTRVALIQPTLDNSAAEGNNTTKFLPQYLTLNEDIVKEKIDREDTKNS